MSKSIDDMQCSRCKVNLPLTFGTDGLYACDCGVRYQLRERGDGLAWFNFDDFEERMQSLEAKVDRLFKLFEGLLEEVEEIKAEVRPETIELRSIPREEAKAEVLAHYLDRGIPMFPSDVSDVLRLDSLLVFQLTQELVAEGKIK